MMHKQVAGLEAELVRRAGWGACVAVAAVCASPPQSGVQIDSRACTCACIACCCELHKSVHAQIVGQECGHAHTDQQGRCV